MCYCTMNNDGERDTLRGVSTIAQRGTGGTMQVDSTSERVQRPSYYGSSGVRVAMAEGNAERS